MTATARKRKGPGGARAGAGRPPSDDPRSERLFVPVTPSEGVAYRALAVRRGVGLATLIRDLLRDQLVAERII